jgi:hypothetical protein
MSPFIKNGKSFFFENDPMDRIMDPELFHTNCRVKVKYSYTYGGDSKLFQDSEEIMHLLKIFDESDYEDSSNFLKRTDKWSYYPYGNVSSKPMKWSNPEKYIKSMEVIHIQEE